MNLYELIPAILLFYEKNYEAAMFKQNVFKNVNLLHKPTFCKGPCGCVGQAVIN
jgi:hypothetical protein